jgi:hypothetical protein
MFTEQHGLNGLPTEVRTKHLSNTWWRILSSFLIHAQPVRLLGRGISPSQDRYLSTEQHKQNKRTQTSMPGVGFEPTTPVFDRAKTVHVLIGLVDDMLFKMHYL